MKKVSVIVPVYNMEDYLVKCLDSLLNQTLEDIEVIVVNDGSKDSSLSIIKEYELNFPNKIILLDKVNGGLSDARNAGLALASAPYIAFVDSDDFVSETMYQTMYDKATSKDFDLVVCDMNYIYPDRIVRAFSNIKQDLFQLEDIKKSMNVIYPSAWNKLFHRRLFDYEVRFSKGIWFEDVEFLYRLYPYIHSIGTIHEPFYQYLQREGSIVKTFDNRLFDYIKNWDSIIQYFKEHGLFESYKKELEYSCVRYLYATFIKAAANYPDQEQFHKAYQEANAFVKKHFKHYRRNLYFYSNGAKGYYLVMFNSFFANMLFKRKK